MGYLEATWFMRKADLLDDKKDRTIQRLTEFKAKTRQLHISMSNYASSIAVNTIFGISLQKSFNNFCVHA